MKEREGDISSEDQARLGNRGQERDESRLLRCSWLGSRDGLSLPTAVAELGCILSLEEKPTSPSPASWEWEPNTLMQTEGWRNAWWVAPGFVFGT